MPMLFARRGVERLAWVNQSVRSQLALDSLCGQQLFCAQDGSIGEGLFALLVSTSNL